MIRLRDKSWCVSIRALVLTCSALSALAANAAEFKSIHIEPFQEGDTVEWRYAQLLEARLKTLADARITSGDGIPGDGYELGISLVNAERLEGAADLARQFGVALPTRFDPGPEGFVLATHLTESGIGLVGIGTDRRGVLFAVGEILRRAVGRGDAIEFPDELNVRAAPRWPVRGLMVTQGFTMRELTGAREWTEQEEQYTILDFALAGANTFEVRAGATGTVPMHDFVTSYGLQTLTIINGNQGSGPPEWQAKEAIGRTGYLSPAIPEARAQLLKEREDLFRSMPRYDFVHIKSGDGGGDESEAAAPYGRAFVKLCEDYARILHQYHPDNKVFVGNQKLDNAGDLAIFEYLQAEPRAWCAGICYGPGSNAMGWTPGRRQDHRMDLFEYAGHGALGGYLREMHHQLPPQQSILLFTDLTHWVYSQYGLMDHEIIADRDYQTPPSWDQWMYDRRPDDVMAMVYDRRTFHARPRNYYRVFQETAPYTIGDVTYSEGHHDHLNQWMYQRLFWGPHRSVEDVVAEYARTYFGPEASPMMAEAILLLEENIQTSIADNAGIDRMVELVESAGKRMPARVMERDYLWREYMQKAYLDKYIQLDVRQQDAAYDETIEKLDRALDRGDLQRTVAALSEVELPDPSREMTRLREAADRLGQESDRIYGVRNDGLFNLDQDYHGFGWLKREIERAAAAPSEDERRAIVARAVHYEEAGEGGFYDDAGTAGGAPHLVYGWAYGDGGFSSTNRRSQRTMAFTTDEERGVTFRYEGLDTKAAYRVRMTLVRPRFLERYAMRQPQTSQSIYADEFVLAENLELPEHVAEFFEFDIPQAATADGALELWLKKQPGVGEGLASDVTIWRNTGGWGTLVSEVWLFKTASQVEPEREENRDGD